MKVKGGYIEMTLKEIDRYIDSLKEQVVKQALKNTYRGIPLHYLGKPIYLNERR